MKNNYHTHTSLCGHARGTIEEYIEFACAHQMEKLGFSDHVPLVGDTLPERMPYQMLPEFLRKMEEMKERYSGKIKLYTGFEVEYFADQRAYYESLLDMGEVEYLIQGQHYFHTMDGSRVFVFRNPYTTEDVLNYAKDTVEGMSTGYFKYLAHPDLFLVGGVQPDLFLDKACDIMINEAVKRNFIFELNANGFRRKIHTYPSRYFWEKIKDTGIRVIIGADAHFPEALGDEAIKKAEAFAADLGLNIIDTISID